MSYFDATLAIHKAKFEPYRALIVLDDKPMRKYFMCWGPQLVRRIDDYPLDTAMADLWDYVRVDYQALADLTGDPMPAVMGRFRQAQGLQLIYPDGTVADAVANVLRKKLAPMQTVSDQAASANRSSRTARRALSVTGADSGSMAPRSAALISV